MSAIIKCVIKRLASKWNIPEDKLYLLYRTYQETAARAGLLEALSRSMGYFLSVRRIRYLIKKIHQLNLKKKDRKLPKL